MVPKIESDRFSILYLLPLLPCFGQVAVVKDCDKLHKTKEKSDRALWEKNKCILFISS